MSSRSVSRKRKQKSKQKILLLPKQSDDQLKTKQKTRLSRQYQEAEKEVQQLLDEKNLALNFGSLNSKETELDTQSIEFFCNEEQSFTISSSTKNNKSYEPSFLDSNGSSEENGKTEDSQSTTDVQEEESEKSRATHSEHSSSTHGVNQTASTFIQIESDHNVCTEFKPSSKFNFDRELLFKPNSKLHHNIRLETTMKEPNLNGNTKRMINRYYEQAKATEEKLSKTNMKSLQANNGGELDRALCNDPISYRTYCLHDFNPVFCDATPNTVDIPIRQLFKILIKEIRFTQHPQLCEEHILANELDDLYEEYIKRKSKKTAEALDAELQIERKVVGSMIKRAEVIDGQSPRTAEHNLRKLQEHLFKVKALRTRLYTEEAYTKCLLKKILDKWLQLKNLRQSQEFQCTRFRLRIKVPELSHQTIYKARKDWESRFQSDLSELYREELETYYSAKRLFKMESNEVALLSARTKPKKPSLSRLSAVLKEKYAESFYMPEEPKIEISRRRISDEEFYENTTKIVNNGNNLRKLRSFFIRIHLDREFVAESRSYRLEPDLSLRVNEAIGVMLERRRPKEIRISLYEKIKLSGPHKIASMIIPFTAKLNGNFSDVDFSMEYIKFISKKYPIQGRLYMDIKCEDQLVQNDFALKTPEVPSNKNERNFIAHDISDEEEEQPTATMSETCTFEESLLQFCSLEDLKSNPRFNILRSRFLKHDERTRELRFVPVLDHELELNIESEDEAVIETGCWMNPIDLHKHYGKIYLRSLYEAIRNQCSRLNRAMESTENLLIGDEPGNWSLLLEAFSTIFRPGRPLNPVRSIILKPTHTSVLEWSGSQNFSVILNVVRATGIPVRYTGNTVHKHTRKISGDPNNFIPQNLKYSNVRPFIALSYKDKICRSTTAEGSNPTWNEQLVLQFNGSLTELREDIKISLFDEIIESYVNDDNVRGMDTYQRIQANWLGEYRLPIGTILQRQKIEGNVEFNVPKVLLGYKRPTLDSLTTNLDTQIIVEIKESVQLYFYLSIAPGFETPRINTRSLECTELKEVRHKLHEWCVLVREMKPQHFVEPLICTKDGKRVCITRLMEPIPLPIANSENLLESVCRYVSLLSTMKHFDPCMGFSGVWLSNQVLLDTTWGSAKDLGVLLCNFMLSIGLKCWLTLGLSNTFGEVTFVIVKNEDGHHQLYEPYSGKNYAIKDILCPLKKIFYIVTTDNIYCNIQADTRVSMMNFNLNDTSCWLPAFSKKDPAPLGGVQKLNYVFHEPLSIAELTKYIERKIMKKISSWRTMQKTVWNRAFQPRLFNILLDLETNSTFLTNNLHEEWRYVEQIAQEFPAYKIYGFAINFPYTNLSAISERIRSTSIHLNSDQHVEYSLAVHVNVWPNDVLSVWIFLISLTPVTIS